MKRIIALLICILTVIGCSFNAFAEDNSETTSCVPSTVNPIHPDLNDSANPQWKVINSINVTFYVINGRATASYHVASQKSGITVNVEIEKRTLGFIWVNVGNAKQEKTNKMYLSGSYSVPVNDSGVYRVVVEVKVSGEQASKTVTFEYDNKILMGDANSDGVIRANDARLILRFSAKLQKYSSNQKKICDINKDGAITAADARIALRMAAKIY